MRPNQRPDFRGTAERRISEGPQVAELCPLRRKAERPEFDPKAAARAV